MAPDQSTLMLSCVEGGTIRWMSPELIDPGSFDLKETHPTKASDCYALGMVIYEVLTGQTPFSVHSTPLVIKKVLEGERPERPQGEEGALFTDDIWVVLGLCWKHHPSERADAKTVLLCLEGASALPQPSSKMDGNSKRPSGSGTFSPFRRRSQADFRAPLRYNRSENYTKWRRTPGPSSSHVDNGL